MARKYLGGSGDRLTVWISIAASTVLIFYGYDQVGLHTLPPYTADKNKISNQGNKYMYRLGRLRKCHYRRGLPQNDELPFNEYAGDDDVRLQPWLFRRGHVYRLDG